MHIISENLMVWRTCLRYFVCADIVAFVWFDNEIIWVKIVSFFMDNVAIMEQTHYESKFPLLCIHVAPFLKDSLLYGRLV